MTSISRPLGERRQRYIFSTGMREAKFEGRLKPKGGRGVNKDMWWRRFLLDKVGDRKLFKGIYYGRGLGFNAYAVWL